MIIRRIFTAADEKSYISGSIDKVQKSLKGCVKFVETPASSKDFKFKITNQNEDGTESKQCYSYPGIYTNNLDNAKKEQNLVLTRGDDGCLGSDSHNILKYFAIGLGQRTEHQRPDRDKYIEIIPENVQDGEVPRVAALELRD